MSLEPGFRPRSVSPASSGRSSPINHLAQSRVEEEELKKDKSYRRYASNVARVLALFETALQEWADYISFLGRLLKALQTHPPNITVIPHKTIVAKRLAQCMNPSLPSGVHQKALDVYAFIFSTIGREHLARDLPQYLPGLTPTLSFASLSVRPAFLSLLEEHVLRLDKTALRPALKAIILSLLPGLEEETSEDFERTFRILDGFRDALRDKETITLDKIYGTGDSYFWQCFFLSSITGPSRRQGALAFLARRLPKLGVDPRRGSVQSDTSIEGNGVDSVESPSSVEDVVSPEPGLLIRCFITGLSDENILIQRGFLDLLVTHLPLDSSVLQSKANPADLEKLVGAAAGVVARRDMSLNRRLWVWLLGPESSSTSENDRVPDTPSSGDTNIRPDHAHYLKKFGLQPLIRSLRALVDRPIKAPGERARPFKICLSLMDRWEVGELLIPAIFLPALENVRSYEHIATSYDNFSEVLRSASVFFDGVESGLIWGEIFGLVTAALNDTSLNARIRQEKLDLVDFIVNHFNIREEEMLIVHMPLVTLALLALVRSRDVKQSSGNSDSEERILSQALSIANHLMEMIPKRAFLVSTATELSTTPRRPSQPSISKPGELLGKIRRFYVQAQGNLDISNPPFPAKEVGELLLYEVSGSLSRGLRSQSASSIEYRTKLFVAMLNKLPRPESIDRNELFEAFQFALQSSNDISDIDLSYSIFSALITVTSALLSSGNPGHDLEGQITKLVDPLVQRAWDLLSPAQPKYHVETVRCLWHLESLTPMERQVEAVISRLVIHGSKAEAYEEHDMNTANRFAVLWTHSVQVQPESGQALPATASEGDRRPSRVAAGNFETMLTRPLFLLLDGLSEKEIGNFMFVRSWLQTLLSIDKILVLILSKLQTTWAERSTIASSGLGEGEFGAQCDFETSLYYLDTLLKVLRLAPENASQALNHRFISGAVEAGQGKDSATQASGINLQTVIVQTCVQILEDYEPVKDKKKQARGSEIFSSTVAVLEQLMLGPSGPSVFDQLEVEQFLMGRLLSVLDGEETFLQKSLMDALLAALKLRFLTSTSNEHVTQRKSVSKEERRLSRLSTSAEQIDMPSPRSIDPDLCRDLIGCIQKGLSSPSGRLILDNWVNFLAACIPLFTDTIYQVLLPLVGCLCAQANNTFQVLKASFRNKRAVQEFSPDSAVIAFLNGLEQVLATAHQRLVIDEAKSVNVKSPDQQQGFFGNMVSGVFTSEANQARSASTNDRLTIVLSFQDSVRICYEIWSWENVTSEGSADILNPPASFAFTSLRVRNRARRILEHLFSAEELECLETLVVIWRDSRVAAGNANNSRIIQLLHVLDGSRPKNTIPAIFNAIYSRTNPGALDPLRKSSLTSNLSGPDMVDFLVDYARSLEEDAMDEIWADCVTFLRDVLSNPFPHRHTLPRLLEFMSILGEKVDETNFGEQRKMRKELGELFVRLLSATFATKPVSISQDSPPPIMTETVAATKEGSEQSAEKKAARYDDVIGILSTTMPHLPKVVVEPDRIATVASIISTNVIAPIFRAKTFPFTVTKCVLDLLYQLSKLANASKSWRKDVADAFNDPRYFSTPLPYVQSHWLSLLRQWTLGDQDRLTELLRGISAPTAAGIMFGVGASSARQEADRKAQLNLRRIAALLVANQDDNFVVNLPSLEEKLAELMTATAASSPSSTTRAEVFMVIRAIVLKNSAVHLASLWPLINSELRDAISSAFPGEQSDTYNSFSLLQACKLLDTLLTIAPDEFQLHEFLFITDTIDAVYRPENWHATGLVDEVSEELDSTSTSNAHAGHASIGSSHSIRDSRRPLLKSSSFEDMPKDDLLAKVLRPFFRQLSIYEFESTYHMGPPDVQTCIEDLLADIFNERTIVS
ncbi:hypothetical protein L228DRAFT_266707 [Xylona heveae TC161]|uniref:Uncharacterized protein n=1 Tax=Xylona heveae (strain CBS 132557 / TC161) TaxID=1328760 RepID=A0A165I4D8_XYLHT|nr:hypothetical protein L228DRAFT_266707 [Xylona heveae TC161]KZF24364.1 hypothetical protein L228DRAFT_266707 [Xylona heveae TC161]